MSTSIATILFAAAITPGPNNLMVMNAAQDGVRAALPAIIGAVTGTVALMFTVRFGLGSAILVQPSIRLILHVIGALLLIYLAVQTLKSGWIDSHVSNSETHHRRLFASIFVLQVVNPKTWVLVTTVSTTHAASSSTSFVMLATLTTLIPAACLVVWAVAGSAMNALFEGPVFRRAFATAAALALTSFSIALIFAAFAG